MTGKEPAVSQPSGTVERSRLHLLAGSLALAVTLASRRRSVAAPALPEVTVFKDPT